MKRQSVRGLLYSQIGYDLKDIKRAVIRHSEKQYKAVRFLVLAHATLKPVLEKEALYWGEKWSSHWWILDFSEVDTAGAYHMLEPGVPWQNILAYVKACQEYKYTDERKDFLRSSVAPSPFACEKKPLRRRAQ